MVEIWSFRTKLGDDARWVTSPWRWGADLRTGHSMSPVIKGNHDTALENGTGALLKHSRIGQEILSNIQTAIERLGLY